MACMFIPMLISLCTMSRKCHPLFICSSNGEVIYVDRGLSHCLSVLWPEERARCRRKLTDMERLIQRPWTNVLIDTDEHMRLSEDAKTPIVFRGLIQHKVLVKVLWREEKGAQGRSDEHIGKQFCNLKVAPKLHRAQKH
jgi:hypothetical protein